jgi:hypothetical protein
VRRDMAPFRLPLSAAPASLCRGNARCLPCVAAPRRMLARTQGMGTALRRFQAAATEIGRCAIAITAPAGQRELVVVAPKAAGGTRGGKGVLRRVLLHPERALASRVSTGGNTDPTPTLNAGVSPSSLVMSHAPF